MKTLTFASFQFLFSAYIPYGKGKYLNQTFFFYQAQILYSTLRLLPIEFNSLQFTLVQCVFVEIFGVFWE